MMHTKRKCYVDLMPTRGNTYCIKMAVAEDKGARTEYKRLVLFEDDLEQFLPAFFKVFNAYKKQKAQSQKAKQGFVQKSIEFPS